jgi:hypothetical protein
MEAAMSRIAGAQYPHDVIVPLSRLEQITVWQPRLEHRHEEQLDQKITQQESVTFSHAKRPTEEVVAIVQRIRQSQINACFAGIFALLGSTLAIANATPNQEIAEIEALGSLLVILLIPLGCNRSGAIRTASVMLTLLPSVALAETFLQPLPNGQSALTWTYDAGLAFAGLGALLATLVFPPFVAWFLVSTGILLPLSLLTMLMPHAPSLVGLDVAAGIVSLHWSHQHQQIYALYDFLFRPFLLIILLGLIGTRLRRFVFHG